MKARIKPNKSVSVTMDSVVHIYDNNHGISVFLDAKSPAAAREIADDLREASKHAGAGRDLYLMRCAATIEEACE